MKTIRPIVLIALAFGACSSDTPTSVSSPGSNSKGQPSAQGLQNPVPVEPTGLCAGKETFKSPTGDVKYCVLASDLQPQGNLCHFVKPEDPPVLRHKIGVITGPVGAYLKEPLGFSGLENDCGAVPEDKAGKGLILLEEADANGGAEIPPNSEKVLTFAFTKAAQDCGRVQSVADLLTQNGTSLKVAGFVLNYAKACTPDCVSLFNGSTLPFDWFLDIDPESFASTLGFFEAQPEFTVPAGWTVTVDASVAAPSITSNKVHPAFTTTGRARTVTAHSATTNRWLSRLSGSGHKGGKPIGTQSFFSVLAAGLACDLDFYDASSSDGTLHFVQAFPTEQHCTLEFATVSPDVTYEVHMCPGLQKGTNDEGPLYSDCGCQ